MSVLLDTHALVWYVEASPRLSASAKSSIQSSIAGGQPVYVSAVSLVEIAYLSEKRRLAPDLFDRILTLMKLGNSGLVEIPFTMEIADVMRQVPGAVVPDMPDRMIAATALHLNVPLATKDARIRASGIPTIW